jgi:hypothetical protein
VIVFTPLTSSKSGTIKVRFEIVAGMPFTVTVAWGAFTVPVTMSLIMPVTVTVEEDSTAFAVGESITTIGGVVSTTTVMLALEATPEELVAVAVITLAPSVKGTFEAVYVPPFFEAVTPLTTTFAAGSLMVPVTLTVVAISRVDGDGEEIVTSGNVTAAPTVKTEAIETCSTPVRMVTVRVPAVVVLFDLDLGNRSRCTGHVHQPEVAIVAVHRAPNRDAAPEIGLRHALHEAGPVTCYRNRNKLARGSRVR